MRLSPACQSDPVSKNEVVLHAVNTGPPKMCPIYVISREQNKAQVT